MSSDVTHRLRRVERELRMWRTLLVAFLVGVFCISASDVPRSISATEFVLLGKAGRKRALLRTDRLGSAALELMNARGEVFATLNEGLPDPHMPGADMVAGPGLTLWPARPAALFGGRGAT